MPLVISTGRRTLHRHNSTPYSEISTTPSIGIDIHPLEHSTNTILPDGPNDASTQSSEHSTLPFQPDRSTPIIVYRTRLEMREMRTSHATLDDLRSFVLKEQYAKKMSQVSIHSPKVFPHHSANTKPRNKIICHSANPNIIASDLSTSGHPAWISS